MRRSKLISVLLICIIAVAMTAVFVGAAFASAGFEDTVAGIDKSKPWGERYALVESAEALYLELSEEEQAEAQASYTALVAEKAELDALGEQAKRFIMFVGTLSDLYDLNEKEEAITLAHSEGVYFDDVTYPGIKEALAELARFEERVNVTVAACVAFVDAVDAAQLAVEGDYTSLKAALTEAEKNYSLLDNTYDGVRGAITTYGIIAGELKVRETYTEEFLRAVEELADKVDYQTYLARYNFAKGYTSNVSFIEEYPGVAEAKLDLEEADTYIKECITKANVFISAVSRFSSSTNIAKDLIAAYRALEGVDLSVNGVQTAKSAFDSTLKTYNDIAEAIIADMEIL